MQDPVDKPPVTSSAWLGATARLGAEPGERWGKGRMGNSRVDGTEIRQSTVDMVNISCFNKVEYIPSG